MPDKCERCDRVRGNDELYGTPRDPQKCYAFRDSDGCDYSEDGIDCDSHAVDWRARVKAAEKVLQSNREAYKSAIAQDMIDAALSILRGGEA